MVYFSKSKTGLLLEERLQRVSHETIYRSLFVQSRWVLAKDLQKHLRTSRPTRRNTHNTVSKQWRSQIKEAVSIAERPAEAGERVIPGDWESQCLCQAVLSIGITAGSWCGVRSRSIAERTLMLRRANANRACLWLLPSLRLRS